MTIDQVNAVLQDCASETLDEQVNLMYDDMIEEMENNHMIAMYSCYSYDNE